MTVRGSEESVEARLRSGLLACWWGGTLRPWGCARPRPVATFAGPAEVVPRRGICRGCGRSHVLLPAWLLSRRKYAAAVIFAALALRAAGLKVSAVAGAAPAAGAGRGRPAVERPGFDGQLVAVPVRRPGRVAASWAAETAAAGRPAGPAGRGGRVGRRGCAGRAGGGHRRAGAAGRRPGQTGGSWGGRAPDRRGACSPPPFAPGAA